MLGSGSAGNSALVSTDHGKILVDGGLSARQIVLRLEQCGVMPDRLDGVLLTHEHGDHVCGLEVLCRKFGVPIYCNALTAEAIQCDGWLDRHRNLRIFRTGADFSAATVTRRRLLLRQSAIRSRNPAESTWNFIVPHNRKSVHVFASAKRSAAHFSRRLKPRSFKLHPVATLYERRRF